MHLLLFIISIFIVSCQKNLGFPYIYCHRFLVDLLFIRAECARTTSVLRQPTIKRFIPVNNKHATQLGLLSDEIMI